MKKVLINLPAILILMGFLASCSEQAQGPPGKGNWKMVWHDEFNGKEVDTSLWIYSALAKWNYPGVATRYSVSNLFLDGNGSLVNMLTRDDSDTYLYNHGLTSKYEKAFGYFEARVRFSCQPGWWTAFWLSGYPYDEGDDCFTYPQEFDIYEDFYKPKNENDIQQTYHVNAGLPYSAERKADGLADMKRCREITRHSLPRKSLLKNWDDWHILALEWTPLEHIFYVDGKVSFRLTYRECPITTVPLRIWLSGCFPVPPDTSQDIFYGKLKQAALPDQFMVDYVRVYDKDWGGKKAPEVTVEAVNPRSSYAAGEPVEFLVNAKDEDGVIKKLYLFSKGRIRDEVNTDSKNISHTFKLSNLFPGQNTLIAMAKDNDSRIGISVMIRLNVGN